MDLQTQIAYRQSQVVEFQELQNAESELQKLQSEKRQEQVKYAEAEQLELLEAGIDEVSKQIDNSVLIEIAQSILTLAKLMAKWKSNQEKHTELFSLIQQQVQLQLKYRMIKLTPSQINAFDQGMRNGLVEDLTKERLKKLGLDVNFDIDLVDNSGTLGQDVRQWFNTIRDAIKVRLNPPRNHLGNY